ncbi:MAG: hypothetical protein TEF_12145 [Rhizobiales bacterium NRL2]|jgi:uncharacterized protein involved in response to NO|nr:MAG: hypothetical protein TEF_02730 [Rhizobiales bacterium NRL2]ANK81469.1 MAG: hypothetical protein TEF_12145 [Rhizobiales bacterium NRL2]
MTEARTAIPRYRPTRAPAVLAQGFRPFFLLAGLYGGGVLLVWTAMLHGGFAPATAFDAVAWHAHEMLYGFTMAVIAGFLLTAIPNWTGRMPLQGLPLLGLVALWALGRVAVWCSGAIGAGAAMALDLGFPAVFIAVVLREIVAGRNWRNLPMVAALTAFTAGNVLMHLEAAGWPGTDGAGARLGLAVPVALITLVGGRIVPSFTRNWLVKRGAARLPASFGTVDRAAMILTLLALAAFVIVPEGPVVAAAAFAAAAAQAFRLARWRGMATRTEPLVAVLHLAYAWIPAGLALLGLAAALPSFVPGTAAVHAFGAGAVGAMTLAVMTRATLGHTGRGLQAGRGTALLYAAVLAAGLSRVAAALLPEQAILLFSVSALGWAVAFLGFALLYGRALTTRRRTAGG